MPQFDEEAADADFLAGLEDFPEVHEGGATNILEMGSGQMPRGTKTAGSTGIPLGGAVDPNTVRTPRRKTAARSKPWAGRGDYASIYTRERGSAMASVDFNQAPPPKDLSEKVAGPIDQRVHEINEGPNGQGFVGKVKTRKDLAAKDEDEPVEMKPKEIDTRSPAALGEGSEVQAGWVGKMAQLQAIGQKEGTVLMSFAEFRMSGRGFNQEQYIQYLQKRCYACADQVEEGVMCHECYASLHSASKTASTKEVVIDILKQADSKSMIVPRASSKTKKFDWDVNRSAEPTKGHRSTEGTGEKDYKLVDADFYHEQNAAILGDEQVQHEDFTLTRGKEPKPKVDEATKERYAAKEPTAGQASIEKEIKVDVEPVRLNPKQKADLLHRKSLTEKAQKFPEGRKSMSDERLVDYDGSKPQDYVTEFNFKGAELVKKDYPYQLMKPQGTEASTSFLPKGDSKFATSGPMGMPVAKDRGGVPIVANGVGRSLADDLGVQENVARFKIGDRVVSPAFQGRGEVADLVAGDDGSIAGAVIETTAGLITVAIGALKQAEMTELTPEQKTQMKQLNPAWDENNPDHITQFLERTKVTAMYRVAAKPNIAEPLHGKVGYKFTHRGRTCLNIPKVGKFFFRDEDLIPVGK